MDQVRNAVCSECRESNAKYKCKECRESQSCSLKCFQLHKEKCQGQSQVASDTPQKDSYNRVSQSQYGNEWTFQLMEEQKVLMHNSERMKIALQNTELRRVIKEIDSAQDPKVALEAAMKENGHLVDFIEDMLHDICFKFE
jgi:hypothetical protein